MTPKIAESLCTVCGRCVEDCPDDVLEVKEGKLVIVHPENCTDCGTCELSCPEGAITTEAESI